MKFCLDPGHGLGNRTKGKFDPGAVSGEIYESDIAMDWTNELRNILISQGHEVVRTRANRSDPASISQRAKIAKDYGCEFMLSFHCNAATGNATGTETFYRGEQNKAMAERINGAVCAALDMRNRGAKTESASQHARLAVMSFQPCFLLEIGFIDNKEDRMKMLNPDLRKTACEAIAYVITKK